MNPILRLTFAQPMTEAAGAERRLGARGRKRRPFGWLAGPCAPPMPIGARLATMAVVLVGLASLGEAKGETPHAAVVPAARQDIRWRQRHEGMNDRIQQKNVDLIFIGDSITQGWESAGKGVWHEYYGHRNAVNLGIGGDETSHVLWRLDHGNLDGISPKLAVVMIGTNNAGNAGHPAEATAEGIKAIVKKLRTKLPHTKILLLGIFPRGADNQDPIRRVNQKTNAIISTLADGRSVFYLDIGPQFLADDGTLSKQMMPDLLHLNNKGYKIWAKAMEPMVAQGMTPDS